MIAQETYYWEVTDDRWDGNCIGTFNGDIDLYPIGPVEEWRCLDGDGNVWYAGIILGEYDGFEPLDDFCGPSFGCVEIQYWNRDIGEWEVL